MKVGLIFTHHGVSVRLVSSGTRHDLGTEGLGFFALVAVQDGHEVADVARREPQGLDLREFGVGRHIGYAIPQIGKGVVYTLGASPLLLIGCVATFNRPDNHTILHPHSRGGGGVRVHHVDLVAARQLLGLRCLLVHVVVVVLGCLLTGLSWVLLSVVLDSDFLDQGWSRGRRAAGSRATTGYSGIGAPVSRLTVAVGNTCNRLISLVLTFLTTCQ